MTFPSRWHPGILVHSLNRFPMLNILLQATVPETSFQISRILSNHRTSEHRQRWPRPEQTIGPGSCCQSPLPFLLFPPNHPPGTPASTFTWSHPSLTINHQAWKGNHFIPQETSISVFNFYFSLERKIFLFLFLQTGASMGITVENWKQSKCPSVGNKVK